MQRNIDSRIEKGKRVISEYRNITALELLTFVEKLKQEDILDCISDAVNFGIALGYEQAKADIKKERAS